ncbi:hypothetical protein PMIN03_004601 [Paraphaeosphaeria minitans]
MHQLHQPVPVRLFCISPKQPNEKDFPPSSSLTISADRFSSTQGDRKRSLRALFPNEDTFRVIVAFWEVPLATMLCHPTGCCQRLDTDRPGAQQGWPRIEAKAYGRPYICDNNNTSARGITSWHEKDWARSELQVRGPSWA